MKRLPSRREFLSHTAAMTVGLTMGNVRDWPHHRLAAQETTYPTHPTALPYSTKLSPATLQMASSIDDATCEFVRSVGITGFEIGMISLEDGEKMRTVVDRHDLTIHNVKRGFTEFHSTDADVIEREIESYRHAIRLAQIVGADSIEVVPATVSGMSIPPARDFCLDYEEKMAKLDSVVRGNNAPFADYIAAHNRATEQSRRAIESLLPFAESHRVTIGIENVGFMNNLWVHPGIYAAYVRSFGSSWVKAYFDTGNNVLYAPSEEWIATFRPGEIAKFHIKDYKIDPSDPNSGRFVPLGEGSVDWLAVRKAIDQLGYSGWATNESDSLPTQDFLSQKEQFADLAARLQKILAGVPLIDA